MPVRRLHASSWQDALDSRTHGSSSTQRMRLKRHRTEGGTTSRMLRTAGRPRCHNILPESEARRRRRDKRKAALNASQLVKQLCRLRVILKTRLTLASDCRRLMRLAAAVRSRGASVAAAFLLLLVDRALRRPKLATILLNTFTKFQTTERNSMEAAWKAIAQVRRRKEARQQNAVLWKGPVGLTCRDFVRSLSAATVVDVISRLGLDTGVVNAGRAVEALAELPHMSSYGAFSILRVLPACLRLEISGANDVARTMSDTVLVMEEFIPLKAALRMSAAASRCSTAELTVGDAALVLCEASKALVVLGVLPAAGSEWTSELLRTSFASKATTALIKTLSTQKPLTDEQRKTIRCSRAAEARLVNAALPPTRCHWDRTPHFCEGAEMMASLLSRQLEGSGWLDPAFGADIFNDVG